MSVTLDTHQEFVGQPYSFPTSQLLLLGHFSVVIYRSIAERSSLRSAKHGRRGGDVVVAAVAVIIDSLSLAWSLQWIWWQSALNPSAL